MELLGVSGHFTEEMDERIFLYRCIAKNLNRNTIFFSLEPDFFFVSQVFLSYLGECLNFFLRTFSRLAQFFFGECLIFETLLGNQWNILRNTWNFLRNKWNFLRNKWIFWETNGTFWETMETFEQQMETFEQKECKNFWEKMETFEKKWKILRNLFFFGHLSIHFSIRPFLCHLDILRKMEHFEKKRKLLRKKWNILRKIRGQNLVEPIVKNPADLDPLFARPFLRARARASKKKKEKFHPPLGSPRTLGPTIL